MKAFRGAVVAGAFMLAAACTRTTPGGHDAGQSGDAGSGSDAGIGLTCAKLLSCDQACGTNYNCTDDCYAETTGHGQGLFNGLNNCISDNCSSADGGVCASPTSSACAQCNESSATGACISYLVKCEDDVQVGPPDPDGGAGNIDAGPLTDAGTLVSCGALVTCEQACTAGDTSCLSTCFDEGTSTAQSLSEALANCVTSACPATDGGPCVTEGTTCSGCRQQADFGSCATPFGACEDDTSATSDGGIAPIPLTGGTISTLATGLSQPQVVLIQNGQAYFSEITADGPILSVPITGGNISTISAAQPFAMGLAIDPNYVYAWNSGTFSGGTALNNSDGSVVRVALAGGAATTLATGLVVAYDAPYLNAITVDATDAFWVTGGPSVAGAINKAPIDASAAASVLYGNQNFPQAVVTDGTDLYWGNWGTYDAQGNYNNDGTIVRGSVTGGSLTTLASGLSAPAAIAIDDENVYWTNIGQVSPGGFPAPNTGSVMQVGQQGGNVVTLASDQNIPLGIGVGGSTVYWAEFTLSSPGSIVSAPVGGGTPLTIVGNVKDPFGLTVAGGQIYWSDNIPTGVGDGAVLQLTP